MEITIGILITLGIGFAIYKFFGKKKESEKPVKPEPKPEPEEPIKEDPVVIEPDPAEPIPKPEKPKYSFVPYRFTGLDILYQTEDSKVFEVEAPNSGEDLTDFVQAKVDEMPSGSLLAPTILRFKGKIWTEGNADRIGINKPNAIIHFKDKHFFIVEGGEFFTKAPFTLYGGNISKGDFSRRRHFRFEDCSAFKVKGVSVKGSNYTEGDLIGTSPDHTPEFWYETEYVNGKLQYKSDRIPGGPDDGTVSLNFPAYKSYWESEHAFDFLRCKNFVAEDLKCDSVWGDGVCLGFETENYIIRNSYLRYTGRQGIALYNSRNGLIENVHLDRGRRAAIDLEPNTSNGYVENIEIKDCHLDTMQVVFAAWGKGIVNNIHIHGCKYATTSAALTVRDSSLRTRRSKWAFIGNKRLTGFGSPQSAITFYLVDGIIIDKNFESLAPTQSQSILTVVDCTDVFYGDNEVRNGKYIKARNSDVTMEDSKQQMEILEI